MKRFMAIGLAILTFCLPLVAWEIRAGVVGSFSGTYGVEAVAEGGLEFWDDAVKTEFGVEGGLSGTVPRILLPAGFAAEVYLDDGLSLGAAAHALFGASFGAPSPAFLWGGEAELRAELAWVPGLALGAGVGARYMGAAWEFPLHLMIEVPLGPEDPFELVSDQSESEREGH